MLIPYVVLRFQYTAICSAFSGKEEGGESVAQLVFSLTLLGPFHYKRT